MTKRILMAGVGLLLIATVGVSEAFVPTRTDTGWPVYWNPKTAHMVLHRTDSRWLGELQKGANAWNNAGAEFTFTTGGDSSGILSGEACDLDGTNMVAFTFRNCSGLMWMTQTLAVTGVRFLTATGQIVEADVLFNANHAWSAYDGPLRSSPEDFRRVLIHELGHVLGLAHPDDYGQYRNAIMNANASDIYTLQPDDIAGIRAIYGVEQTPPAPPVPRAPLTPPAPRAPRAALENPQANAFKSGIGIISGWACTARTVEVQVDTHPRIRMVYGTPRADTRAVCGDTHTGFVTLVNWNLFGTGGHTIRLYVDGISVGAARFTVTRLGGEFVRGLQGSYTLPDFPRVGRETSIRWEESSQNFVIDEVR